MTNPSAGRIAYFDNLKYILIVLVVIGHFIDPFSKDFSFYSGLFFSIYLFHMPLFVLVTGMFARGLIRSDGRFRLSRVFQFLALYLLLYLGIAVLEYLAGKPLTLTPWTVANASWYLLAAAIWYLLVPLIARIGLVPGLVGSVVLALVVGYLPFIGDVFAISRVICFAPFFLVGYWWKPDTLQRFFDRSLPWKIAAALLLAGAFAAPFWWPRLLKLRGLLSARNSYAFLDHYASFGAGFRASWYLAAAILGACLLVLIPRGRHWFSTIGERTLQIYMWHLWSLRALALVAVVPLTALWAKATPVAMLLPLVLALVAAHLFALRPPFGLVSDRILRLGKGWTVSGRTGFIIAVATAVAVPLAALTLSGRPLTLAAAASAESSSAPLPQRTPVGLAAVSFDAPLEGAVGFAAATITLAPADGLAGGTLKPGQPFMIRTDHGDTWVVTAGSAGGSLDPRLALVNLPDLVPSLVLPGAASPGYRSSGTPIAAGAAALIAPNPRFGAELPYLPVSLATAQKVQLAQRAALADGNTLIVYATWRPAVAQQKLAESMVAAYDSQPQVRTGIDGDGWDLAWFLPSAADLAGSGDSVEVGLGKLSAPVEPWQPGKPYRAAAAVPYSMPTAARELSRAAATTVNPPRPGQPTVSAPLNDPARTLISYGQAAGLSVAPSAWWRFDDPQARSWQQAPLASGWAITLPT